MAVEPIERDVETEIDLQLRDLGWIDSTKSVYRNVYKQQPKTEYEKQALNGFKPDYVLYDKDTPLIIIEAKRPNKGIDEALTQGLNYARLINVPIVIATNGIKVKAVHVQSGKILFIDGEEVSTFFNIKTACEFVDNPCINTINPIVIKSRNELIGIFKKANNLLRDEGLKAGHERFSAFSNILFLKLISELQEIKRANNETNIIPKEYLWKAFRKKSGNELTSYINDTVLKQFDNYYRNNGESIFGDTPITNSRVLKEIIQELDPLQLTDIETDIKGDAFEYFLKTYNAGEKDLGEYFTPRHIVKFLVQLLNPKLGETIYDPFCGTGGMLIEVFKHLYRTSEKNDLTLNILKTGTIFGREISSTAKIAKMNMILMGDGHNNIKRIDSLANPVEDEYSVVITNMPFSQKTNYGSLYKIPTEDANSICIQHCIKAINKCSTNGRIGIIVPEKVLFDKNYKLLREEIYKTCKIENIISLPGGVFEPYTNVQASILHLTKIKQNISTNNIKFYFVKNDGYSLDKVRKKLKGESDLDKFFNKDTSDISVDIEKIKNNNYILQGKKYINPKQFARLIFKTCDLYKLAEFLLPCKKEKIIINENLDYEILGVKSYGLGISKEIKKGYEILSGTSYYKAKPNHLLWCKVDTKNGAFAVVPENCYNSVITANREMLEIDIKKYNPKFLELMFRNQNVQEYFDNYVSGSTNRKYVKKDELLNFYFPKIDISVQNEIVKQVLEEENNILKSREKIIELIKI